MQKQGRRCPRSVTHAAQWPRPGLRSVTRQRMQNAMYNGKSLPPPTRGQQPSPWVAFESHSISHAEGLFPFFPRCVGKCHGLAWEPGHLQLRKTPRCSEGRCGWAATLWDTREFQCPLTEKRSKWYEFLSFRCPWMGRASRSPQLSPLHARFKKKTVLLNFQIKSDYLLRKHWGSAPRLRLTS